LKSWWLIAPAMLLGAATVPVHAEDFACHIVSTLDASLAGSYTRHGLFDCRNGDVGSVVVTGVFGKPNDKGQFSSAEVDVTMGFSDGSATRLHADVNWNPDTGDQQGSGHFVAGKGRFEGIAGGAKFTGKVVDKGAYTVADWTGSYNIKK
jgi:hypothetical protein